MKKLLIILFTVLAFTACQKSNETPKKAFHIDPNSTVRFTGEISTKASDTATLSPLEVVKQAEYLVGYNDNIASTSVTWTWPGKDTTSAEPALLRWGTDIIYDTTGYGDYGLQKAFIDAYDLVICKGDAINSTDTIAYIPNSTMQNARTAILRALNDHDTTTIYSIFKGAFKFIPITGAEYLQLKQNNQQ